jgi:hypothetical protein
MDFVREPFGIGSDQVSSGGVQTQSVSVQVGSSGAQDAQAP